jgi:predicted enzyme related to lactoylglutathione lyase
MNMSLWTDDVRATAKTLKDRGVEFVVEPKKEEWGVSAIFKDSEGNRFVLSSR